MQYVDDLLIARTEKEELKRESIRLLNFLAQKRLRVSEEKLQFEEEKVKYLRHYLFARKKILDPERVKEILELPMPNTKRQIRQALGLFRYCKQWIKKL